MSDFQNASAQTATNLLKRIVHHIDEAPLKRFIEATLPTVDFESWFEEANSQRRSMVGSGTLNWPLDRAERVAMQIMLCRTLAEGKVNFLGFLHQFFYSGKSLPAHFSTFTSKLLSPLLRDIMRLAEQKPVPEALRTAVHTLAPSGDEKLDSLISDAIGKFQDPDPQKSAEAVEKLWDAWERLKSLEDSADKKKSVEVILNKASADLAFRALLEEEAALLTKIGNNFHIRHFETNKTSITDPAHFEYLFQRLFALVHLLLQKRIGGGVV
jgi:hypothetical protein